MKYIILFTISSLLVACETSSSSSNNSNIHSASHITNEEFAILDSANVESDILSKIRIYTDSTIHLLKSTKYNYDEVKDSYETETICHSGFYFLASQEGAQNMVLELKDDFNSMGYLIYISEENFGYYPDEVSVLKSKDQFDILKAEGTDGTNWGLNNDDIIAQLKTWNNNYPFEIVGAGYDFVVAIFLEKPNGDDMKKFAREVYKFCPDVVDQGTGTVEELEKEMIKSGMLYLWWD